MFCEEPVQPGDPEALAGEITSVKTGRTLEEIEHSFRHRHAT